MTEMKMEDLVKREIAEALGRDPEELGRDAWLKRDLGVESIDLIDLTFRFEKALGKPLPEQEIFRSTRPDGDLTIGELVSALEAVKDSTPSS